MNREALIKVGIQNLEGNDFEKFSYVLLSRDLYKGLNPTSQSGDLGEDARTEPSTLFLHDGKWISLATSKEHGWDKVKKDCDRCKETGRKINILVFVTAGNPRTTTIDRWEKDVKKLYGWDLEVKAINFLAPYANRPEYEDIADQYLQVPPLGGDFLTQIRISFAKETERALRNISILVPGIADPIEREELFRIEAQIELGKSVLFVGEAGSGKSGIAYHLAINSDTPVLFLDARRLGEIKNSTELRHHFGLQSAVEEAIIRLGNAKGCRVIIDQIDNSIGLAVSDLLIDLVLDILGKDGVEIVVVSRKRETHEIRFLKKLSMDEGFVELNCNPLSESIVKSLLGEMGIESPSDRIVMLGTNLLNLEIIGRIYQEAPTIDFSNLDKEIDLWEEYIDVIRVREGDQGESVISEAIKLATLGIRAEDRSFPLDVSRPREQNRLESWNIIICDYGRVYRFHHEKLQDYLYAFDATERGLTKDGVLNELGESHRTRNIYLMMRDIYERNIPARLPQYLREVWDV